jgi:hypothetical protein
VRCGVKIKAVGLDGQIDLTQLSSQPSTWPNVPSASANSLLSVQPSTLDLPARRPLGLEGAVFCPSALRDARRTRVLALPCFDVLRPFPPNRTQPVLEVLSRYSLGTTDRHMLLGSVCFCVPRVPVVYMLDCSEPRRSNNNNNIVSRACRESGSSSHHEHEHEHEHEPSTKLDLAPGAAS